ncbi:MAG: squalene/phytoene synthase family protein [Afipia sp.]|jgi:phytoene synthase|nr:squalene/phytoene synthase family protein [Afipia sp.]
MSADDRSAQAFCADLARARDFNAYAASLFVSPEQRRAWLALAAFNVEVSQVRDHISQPLPGEIRLQWWRDVLTGEGAATAQDAQANPVAAELLKAIAHYDLPVASLVRLIDAHVFDIYDDPMPDMAALEAHCRDTSAAMYRLRATVLGANFADVERLAEHAGIADGLTEIMLSLPMHAARRQLYLPGDLLQVHHVVTEEVFLRQQSAGLREALSHLRREACSQRDQAMGMLTGLPPSARAAFLPLAQVARVLLQLEKSSPFEPPLMSRLAVLWTLWRAARANL